MFDVLSILPTAAPLSVMPSSAVTDMVDGNFIHDVIAVAAPKPLVHAKGTVNEDRISDTLSVVGAFYLRTSVYFAHFDSFTCARFCISFAHFFQTSFKSIRG